MSSKRCELRFRTFATSVLGFDICEACTRPKSCFGGVIEQSGYLVSFIFLIFRSFVVSGGSAVYVAAYSVFYFVTKLEIDEFVPTLLYFSYTVTFYSWIGSYKFYR